MPVLGHDGDVKPGRYQETRTRGRAILAVHLGIDEPTVPVLLAMAREVLGPDRAQRCVEHARQIKLTRRYHGLAAIASLIAGTRQLGQTWWSRTHVPPVDSTNAPARQLAPDERLASSTSVDGMWPPTLIELGYWVADDAAVAPRGPLVDEVDLNDPRAIDRIRRLPADVAVGDRLTAHFDAGGVVDAVVEERDGGVLGTRLDGESRYSVPAEVDWAWAVALPPPGPFPLPGDEADPYVMAIDGREARDLRAEAQRLGWQESDLGPTWTTRGDVCAALAHLDWPWLDGGAETFEWTRRMEALVDRER